MNVILLRLVGMLCVLWAVTATAQTDRPPTPGAEARLVERGPLFFAVGRRNERVDARHVAVLQRRIVLNLRDVTVAQAVDTIAARGGMSITYDWAILPATKVTFGATDVSVAAALTSVLLDAGLDVEMMGPSRATLIRREDIPTVSAPPPRPGGGTISGTIVDSATQTPVPFARVRVDETGVTVQAGAQGRYTLTGLAAGHYHLTARRVGYTPNTRLVTVDDDQVTTVNFLLDQPPTKLDEVVTTALGDQRRYSVGNTIATINVDSVARAAPVTGVTDLISARAPGVEVLENSGVTGAGAAIRIRGLASLVLQNDPIVIVDGVRQDNTAGGDVGSSGFYGGHPTPNRLNDLDFADIATIDVLKGPAASTEYGTDAANGVIVVTTKHGTAGGPRWQLSAERARSDIPVSFPDLYYSWGHTTDATHAPIDCSLLARLARTCAVDSVTKANPLNHAATSIFGAGNRSKYGVSVSGGSDAARYYIAGGLSNQTGVLRMPPVFRHVIDSTGLTVPASAFDPDGEQQRSARANTAIRLGATADLSANASYLSTNQATPNVAQFIHNLGPLTDAAHQYGYQFAEISPLSALSDRATTATNRVTGGLSATWRPSAWFVGAANAGIDHGSSGVRELNYPLADPSYLSVYPAFLGLSNTTTDVYSADVRGTVTAHVTGAVRTASSVGLQMVDTRTTGQSAFTYNITPVNLTLNGATSPTTLQIGDRRATLGGYGEEQVGIVERLFLTGAVRIDAASGFGSAYSTAVYPKASASWLAITGGATTVRLRGAFGASGVQPSNGAALRLYQSSVAYANGGPIGGYQLSWPGNPDLRPERSIELEGGVDLGGWGDRVNVELTAYEKTTRDALVDENLGLSLGSVTFEQNIGKVRNEGVEASLSADVIRHRFITWNVTANASVNHNTLVSIAPGVSSQMVGAIYFNYRQAAGFPLYGLWGQRVTYADANHDGILDASEVHVADSATYIGPSAPTREVSLSTRVGLWGNTVTLSGLADYRGGYRIANSVAYGGAAFNTDQRGQNLRSAPLWEQARDVAAVTAPCCNEPADFFEDGSFIRVREVALTYAIPAAVARLAHVRSASLTAAVRNLALWTRYTGPDPEVTNSVGSNVQQVGTSNLPIVNNDMRDDEGAVPLARYWVLRLTVGF